MRILYLCADHGIPISGRLGSSTHVREFCRALQAAGHQVTLLASNAGDDTDNLDGLDVHIVEPPRSKKLGYDLRNILHNRRFYRKALELGNALCPQAIYERNSLYATAGAKLARNLNIPRILEINAFLSDEHRDKLHFRRLARRAEEKIARPASAVAVVTEGLKHTAIERGVDGEKIFIMPTAVDIDLFQPHADLRTATRSELGLSNQFVVGYVGGLAHWHGIDGLYGLCARIRERCPAMRFLVVGGREKEIAEHRARADSEGVSDLFHFAGSVAYTAVPAYLNAMDTAIIPDTMPHTCPTKLFEYMAAGLPPVAPAYESIRSNLENKSEGLLFSPSDMDVAGNALVELYENRDDCRRMGSAARERVAREHSWECNVRRTEERLRSL